MKSDGLSRIEAVFLDDGGVMNDNALRAPQWRRMVGEYLPSRLGGDAAAWAAANREVLEREMFMWQMNTCFALDGGYIDTWRSPAADRAWRGPSCPRARRRRKAPGAGRSVSATAR